MPFVSALYRLGKRWRGFAYEELTKLSTHDRSGRFCRGDLRCHCRVRRSRVARGATKPRFETSRRTRHSVVRRGAGPSFVAYWWPRDTSASRGARDASTRSRRRGLKQSAPDRRPSYFDMVERGVLYPNVEPAGLVERPYRDRWLPLAEIALYLSLPGTPLGHDSHR